MGLSEFLGNARLLEAMRRRLSGDGLPSSMLFTGIEGIGKKTLAQFAAKALNCRQLADDFCGECESCRKIEQRSHPDVRHYSPEGLFIKIDQMRELTREVYFKPFEGRRRVFILDEAHRLRLEAANAILKTLEEPPETSLLILITDSPNDVLGTIRSRCQLIRFNPFSPAELEGILRERSLFPAPDLPLAGRVSGGSLGRAMNLDLEHYRQARKELLMVIRACAGVFSYHRASRITDPLTSTRRKGQFEFRIAILYDLLRDLFILRLDPSSRAITNIDLQAELAEISSTFTPEQIENGIQSLDHLSKGLGRNLNKMLAMDRFLFSLSGVSRQDPPRLHGRDRPAV